MSGSVPIGASGPKVAGSTSSHSPGGARDKAASSAAAAGAKDESADADKDPDEATDQAKGDDKDEDDDQDQDQDEDEDDAEGDGDEDEDEDEDDSAAPKTAIQQLVALVNKSCQLVTRPRDRLNAGLAQATAGLSAAWPALPAATVGALAIGLPHAHPAHPPFVPLPPIGPVLLGFSCDVFINGMPALVNGALGMSPTCCGLSPFYEVFTGSSKVLIGGERAVRMLDLTFHCQSATRKSRRPRLPQLRRALEVTERALEVVHKAEDAADYAEESAEVAHAVHAAADSPNPALRAAVTQSATMAMTSRLAETAQDQLCTALAKLMGRDPAAPTATPGAVVRGAANVLIGGIPLPGGSAVVRGLLRLLPGQLHPRAKRRPGRAATSRNDPQSSRGHPELRQRDGARRDVRSGG